MKRWHKILLGLVAAAVVALGVVCGVGWHQANSTYGPMADAFMRAWQSGDAEALAGLVHSSVRADVSASARKGHARWEMEHGAYQDLGVTGFMMRSSAKQPSVHEVNVDLRFERGTMSATFTFMEDGDGVERLASFTLDLPPVVIPREVDEAALTARARETLATILARDWQTLHAAFSPHVQAALSVTEVAQRFGPFSETCGPATGAITATVAPNHEDTTVEVTLEGPSRAGRFEAVMGYAQMGGAMRLTTASVKLHQPEAAGP